MSSSISERDYSDLSENAVDGDQVLDGNEVTISGFMFQPLVTTHVAFLFIQDDNNKIPEEPRSSFEGSDHHGKQFTHNLIASFYLD